MRDRVGSHEQPACSIHRPQIAGQSGQEGNAQSARACYPAKCPEPPEWLHEYARQEWWRVAPQLHVLGLLSSVDIACLAAYCSSYEMWREASETLANEGLLDTTLQGDKRRHPLIKIIADAASDMVRYAASLD